MTLATKATTMNAPLQPSKIARGGQAEAIAHLSDPASYDASVDKVVRIDTHSAIVFLAGDCAYKIKRAVKFDYLDFSSLARRRRMCLRELELNRRAAPKIYKDVVALTRETDGQLKIGGRGRAIEWIVRMHRFDQNALLSNIAQAGGLDSAMCKLLAEAVAKFHDKAGKFPSVDGPGRMAAVLAELGEAFSSVPELISGKRSHEFVQLAQQRLNEAGEELALRAAAGDVRRCHGDLHLNNIVLLSGQPMLFDAIDFSDEFATIDTLYDLAFLLMDLEQNGLRQQANILLNHYLFKRDLDRDLSGLSAMPLFLSCRAGIRAMVTIQRLHQLEPAEREPLVQQATQYFDRCFSYLTHQPAGLIAVGGLSGTGKSTLAAALAPRFGAAPGAVHLRSDLERKALFGVAETCRLGASHYSQEANKQVYARLSKKAELLLKAGRTVILDAVNLTRHDRQAAEQIAERHGAKFQGLWLTAPSAELHRRVDARTADASDANSQVVDAQIAQDTGVVSWTAIDAGGDATQTIAAALNALARG